MSSKASSLGGYAPVTLVNWNSTGTCSCPADLVDGKIDILVNIAVAKIQSSPGVTYGFGGITACMKNHLGTFTSVSGASASSVGLHPATGKPPLALFEINQHPAILGGNPVRQQLCIVDALFSSTGAASPPDNVTNRLVMGTFAPMVDYFTANYILLNPAVMTTTPVPPAAITAGAAILPQFATSFGYTAPAASPTAPDPSWVSYPASNPPPINPSGSGGTSGSVDAGGGGGGASGSKDAGGGGTSGSADAGSGGASGSKDAGGGGTSGSVDAGGGGTSGSADAGSGVPSGSVDAGGGVPSGSADASSGGTTVAVDAASGVPSGSADAASGGTPSGAGGAGGTGGPATGSEPASADAATPGGTSTGTGTGAIPTGGSVEPTGSTAPSGKSGGGCDVAGVDRRATRWGAMLAFGAVVAEKLRRLAGGKDRSS
jgi:hypothetical protein